MFGLVVLFHISNAESKSNSASAGVFWNEIAVESSMGFQRYHHGIGGWWQRCQQSPNSKWTMHQPMQKCWQHNLRTGMDAQTIPSLGSGLLDTHLLTGTLTLDTLKGSHSEMNLSEWGSLPGWIGPIPGWDKCYRCQSQTFFGYRHPSTDSNARSHTLDQWWSSYLVTPCKPHDFSGLGHAMVVLFLLQACTACTLFKGQRLLNQETWEVALGASMQQNNPISLSTKVPAPQMVLSTRYGWKPNVDVGTQLYLGGGSMDIRYQFAQVDDWYFAIAPTISGLYAEVYGNVSLQVPIRAQTALNDKWELTLGVTPTTQQLTLIQLDPYKETLVSSSLATRFA